MFKIVCRFLLTIPILFFGYISTAAAEMENVHTFADIANILIDGTDFITRIMLVAAIAMGTGFIIFAFSTYRQHRMTPKLVPLDRPILYFILGISLCCIPFLSDIFGAKTYSTLDLKGKSNRIFSAKSTKPKTAESYTWDIDAPLEPLEPLDVAEDRR